MCFSKITWIAVIENQASTSASSDEPLDYFQLLLRCFSRALLLSLGPFKFTERSIYTQAVLSKLKIGYLPEISYAYSRLSFRLAANVYYLLDDIGNRVFWLSKKPTLMFYQFLRSSDRIMSFPFNVSFLKTSTH